MAARDLFFAERLGTALLTVGHQVQVVDLSLDSAPPDLHGLDLAVIDLEAGAEALDLVRRAGRDHVSVLAFGPHTDPDLRREALQAGATQVVAKSKLTSSLQELVSGLLAR